MDAAEVQWHLGEAQRLLENGDAEHALPFAVEAATHAVRIWSDAPGSIAATYNTLAEAYRRTGELDSAEPLYLEAIDLAAAAFGPVSAAVAVITTNLARLLHERGDAMALAVAARAVGLSRTVHGESHPGLEDALRVLARVQAALGDASGELASRTAELTSLRSRLGEHDAAVLNTANELVVRAFAVGDLDLADRFASAYVEGIEGATGRSFELANALDIHAEVYLARGDLAAAAARFAEEIELRRDLQGSLHPDLTSTMEKRALALWRAGALDAAAPAYEELVEQLRARHDQAELARCLHNLASIEFSRYRLDDARARFEECMEILRRERGEGHPDLARAMQGLGTVCQRVGEHSRAEALLAEAVGILRGAGPAYRPDAATALVNLSAVYTSTDRFAAAEAALRDAVELRVTAFGHGDATTLDALSRLADLLDRTGRHHDAIAALEQALAALPAPPGARPASAFDLNRQLARVLRSTGQTDRARNVLEIELATLGSDPRQALVLEDLAQIEESAGELAAARHRAEQLVDALRSAGGTPLATARSRMARLDGELGDLDAMVTGCEEVVDIVRSAGPGATRVLADSLGALGDAYRSAGRFADARTAYREAILVHHVEGRAGEAVPLAHHLVDMLRGASDASPIELAVDLNQLGELSRLAGSPADAVAALDEARSIARDHGDESLTAAIANNLGLALAALGEHVHARSVLEEAVEGFRAQGEWSEGLAFSLNNLSQTLEALGEHDAADRALDESLDVRRHVHGTESAEYAGALLNLGLRLVARGDLDPAEAALREASLTLVRARGIHHPDFAVALNGLGYLHRRRGRYQEAEDTLRLALNIQTNSMAPDDTRIAPTLDNLAGVLHVRGDVVGADQMFRRALAIVSAPGLRSGLALGSVLNNYAQMLMEVGRRAEAEEMLTQALAISRTERNDVAIATAANNLGLLRSEHDRADALPLLEQALALRQRAHGDEHIDVAQSMNNVACAIEDDDPDRACRLHERALEIRRRLLGPDHPDVAESSNNLSFVCGDDERARDLLADAVRIRRATNDGVALADTLTNLAFADARAGALDRSLALFRESAEVRDRLIARVGGLSTEAERLRYLTHARNEFAVLLVVVLRLMPDRPDALRLACDLTLRRKGVVTEGTATLRAAVLQGRYPTLRDELQQLDELRAEVARSALGGTAAEPGDDARAAIEAQQRDLEIELARQIPELDTSRRLRHADTAAVADAIPAGAALVELVRVGLHHPHSSIADVGERYVAFVIPAGHAAEIRLVDVGPADVIDRLVIDLRAAITSPPGWSSGREVLSTLEARGLGDDGLEHAGAALRQAVFSPLATVAGASRLLISPDGELCRLPFEVLPLEDGRRVIDDYTISYLSAGRDVLRAGQAAIAPRSGPVVVADPDYDLTTDQEIPTTSDWRAALRFTPLPGTRREAQHVAALLGVDPLLGADAVEATVKQVAGPSALHIATHGFFDPGTPDPRTPDLAAPSSPREPFVRAGLALAGANAAGLGRVPPAAAEDGILTAEDLAQLDLYGTKLVVLSACETGLGRVHAGEGVFGLRRSIALSGAETLVMSLWKVPDFETCALMEHFYRELLDHADRAAALRTAQLALKEQRPHPYFWGAFVCEGAFGPIDW